MVARAGGEEWAYARAALLRTSLLPFDEFVSWGSELDAASADATDIVAAVSRDTERLRAKLRSLWERPEVREAVFIASPELTRELTIWLTDPDSERGQKLERALVRYFSRMTQRATPFGTFAGVSAIPLAARSELTLPGRARYSRQTRVDSGYLCALADRLAQREDVLESLTLRPNASLYRIGERLRFTAVGGRAGERRFKLAQLEPDLECEGVLARASKGATLDALAQGMVTESAALAEPWSVSEARAYVRALLERGVLEHSLEPPVTGDEPLDALLGQLAPVPAAASEHEALQAIRRKLALADERGLGVPLATYLEIFEALERLLPDAGGSSAELAKAGHILRHWLQVDLAKPAGDLSLNASVLRAAERGVRVLQKITPRSETGALDEFRARFEARYDGREVPLLEALDEELGVGVQGPGGADGVPLLHGLVFPTEPALSSVIWDKRERHLLSRLQSTTQARERELVLTDDDIARMAAERAEVLAEARFTVLTVAAASTAALDAGDFRVWLGATSGPSGAAIAGRFCRLQPEILQGVSEHLRAEEALRPDAVFAEIAHLPEGRAGNIASRPALRDYEISLATTPGVVEERRLPLGDLTLRLNAGRLELRSKRLGKEVIPRLTNAHNFAAGFTVYRFLSQLQGVRSLQWSWGPLDAAPFLPRVSYGNIVFSLARWVLDERDLEPLRAASQGMRQAVTPHTLAELRARVFSAARAIRERLGLPRYVVLVDGDNTLSVDFENVLSVDSFAQLVRSRSSAELRELWPAPEELVVRGVEGAFFHEIVVPMQREQAPTRSALVAAAADVQRAFDDEDDGSEDLPRSLLPGSECAYLKLYTGSATCDRVLCEHLAPLLSRLRARGAVRNWFFVRYADPDWHLRVRVFGAAQRIGLEAVPELQAVASELCRRGLVWRVQYDTYERELERYGGASGIVLAERLFGIDSDAVAAALSAVEAAHLARARWLLALRGMHNLLEALGLGLEERATLLEKARDSLAGEHGTSAVYQQLGERFRQHKTEVFAALSDAAAPPSIQAAVAELDARLPQLLALTPQLQRLARRNGPRFDQIGTSYLHMHANRVLSSSARRQEVVLYDFLRRHALAMLATSGKLRQVGQQ